LGKIFSKNLIMENIWFMNANLGSIYFGQSENIADFGSRIRKGKVI
jgi:hypothetical protein